MVRFSSYRFIPGETRNSSMFCGLNPTSTFRKLCSVRRNNPAPTSRTTEIATCTTSSAFPRMLRVPTMLRPDCFKAAPTSPPVARIAGAMPKRMPVATCDEQNEGEDANVE